MTLILEATSGRSTLETLREAYEHAPDSTLFMPLADQLRVRGEYGEAIDLCRRGKDLFPGYVSCRVLLARCLMELGMREEARGELEEILELDRENVVSLRVLAEILRAQGRLSEATDYYRAALRINPVDMDARERLTVLVRIQKTHEDETPEEADPMPVEPLHAADSGEPVRLTETIELDAYELSDVGAFQQGSYAVQGETHQEKAAEESYYEEESRLEVPDAVPAAPTRSRDRSPGLSMDPSPFFKYDVRRSDFSTFTEWMSKIRREVDPGVAVREGKRVDSEREREESLPDRE
jgi:tetratricopeptide (TPR) repeat protein